MIRPLQDPGSYLVSQHQARHVRPGQKLTIELRLDGFLRYRFGNRYLELDPVAELPHLEGAGTEAPRRPRTSKAAARSTQARTRSSLA